MTVPAHRVRRALTGAELNAVFERIDAATDTTDLLTGLLACLFDTLLADLGESRADYGPDRSLDPRTLAIPEPQWTAISSAATGRAHAWGTGALLALELVNLMPSAYTDPAATVPERPQRDYRPDVLEVEVSRQAVDTIAACEAHLTALAGYFGPSSDEYREAHLSWHRQLAGLFTSMHGECVIVGCGGQLSLVVTTSGGLTFWVVFHGRRRACTAAGCHALTVGGPVAPDGGEPVWRPAYSGAPVLDHAHVPAYPLDAPQPGTWSFHS